MGTVEISIPGETLNPYIKHYIGHFKEPENSKVPITQQLHGYISDLPIILK